VDLEAEADSVNNHVEVEKSCRIYSVIIAMREKWPKIVDFHQCPKALASYLNGGDTKGTEN
jgi:hypothetical protein